MADWQAEFKNKTITPEEAAAMVKSGDRVIIPATSDPMSLEMALIARKEELSDVIVQQESGLRDLPWYDPEWADSFKANTWQILEPNVRRMITELKGGDLFMANPRLVSKVNAEAKRTSGRREIVFTEVSPPDEHGFCSFGPTLWDKKDKVLAADIAVCEIREEFIRTYGDNFVHISDIDYFVHTDYPPVKLWGAVEPKSFVKPMIPYIAELIKDGDTLEIGVGTATEGLVMGGLVEGRHDLGWHAERIPRGALRMMRENPDIFSGKRKTVNQGKAVVTAVALTDAEDAQFIHMNPGFEFYGPNYVHDIHTISRHDNMVAINNALMIDLTGQVCVESIGPIFWGGIGGQFEFVCGAALSRGGRSFTVLPSTGGKGVSRIVTQLPQGSFVSIPRHLIHYVVTEYGRANLMGKTHKERVEELISIAHPDHRADLRREARKVFG